MKIKPFELERWFAKYEHKAELMLSESGIRSLKGEEFDFNTEKIGYVIPTNGDPELRNKIAKKYGVTKNNVLFTVGTQEANFLTFLSILSEEDHAVIITPTYQALHSIPETLSDISKVWLEPPEWKLNINKVKEKIKDNTKLIVINNPNNPTGKYHSKDKISKLYELANKNNAYLLCDEVYRLLDPNPIKPVASMGNRGISTTSLTKSYGLAGLRFGWIVASEKIINKAWNWKDYTTISPSIISQNLAKQVIEEKEDQILKKNRKLAERNRKIVQKFINNHNLNWHKPVGVNGFITVPEQFKTSEEFCKKFFEEKKILLAPGSVFGYDKYFRIGFGLKTEDLKYGLSKLSEFLTEQSNPNK